MTWFFAGLSIRAVRRRREGGGAVPLWTAVDPSSGVNKEEAMFFPSLHQLYQAERIVGPPEQREIDRQRAELAIGIRRLGHLLAAPVTSLVRTLRAPGAPRVARPGGRRDVKVVGAIGVGDPFAGGLEVRR